MRMGNVDSSQHMYQVYKFENRHKLCSHDTASLDWSESGIQSPTASTSSIPSWEWDWKAMFAVNLHKTLPILKYK